MGLEKSFQLNADVSHAVNMVVQTVVAGVFGEIPLTQEEKDAKFDAFKVMLAEMPKVETSWAQLESNAKTGALTMETLLDAVEKLKQYKAPAPQGPQVGEAVQEGDGWKVYDGAKWVHVAKEFWDNLGPVTIGKGKGKAPKSGLPAAQNTIKAAEAALDELLVTVQQRSDELLGIKQKAKYEELAGIDPEET